MLTHLFLAEIEDLGRNWYFNPQPLIVFLLMVFGLAAACTCCRGRQRPSSYSWR
jgi:hypothetical protein